MHIRCTKRVRPVKTGVETPAMIPRPYLPAADGQGDTKELYSVDMVIADRIIEIIKCLRCDARRNPANGLCRSWKRVLYADRSNITVLCVE